MYIKVLSTFSLYLGTNEGVANFGFQRFLATPLTFLNEFPQ